LGEEDLPEEKEVPATRPRSLLLMDYGLEWVPFVRRYLFLLGVLGKCPGMRI
jgi:hypothetical protein